MKTRADRIRWVRKEHRMSQEKFAEALGTTRGAVGNWELGKGIKMDNLSAISERFKIPMEWLAKGGRMPDIDENRDLRSEDIAAEPEAAPGRSLRVTGYVGANGTTGFYALAHDRYDMIPGAPNDPPDAEALEIIGTSAGRFFDGGYVVIGERRPVSPDMIGKPCVVWLPDGRILFKEIRKNGAFFDLWSNDSAEPPIPGVKIKSAARMMRVIPR